MYEDKVAGIVRRAKKIQADDKQWHILYEELAHYFLRMRKGFLNEVTPGSELNEDIWNDYPETARGRFAGGAVAAMCPKDRMWVGLQPVNQALRLLPQVRQWCDIAARQMYAVIYDPRCNFTERMNEIADDCSTFGMGVMLVDHDGVAGHLVLQVQHLKDFAFEFDHNGKITAQYCFWKMSLGSMVKMFGIDNLPDGMREEYGKPDCDHSRTYEIIHAILPNDDFARYGLLPGNMPLRSIWVLCKDNHVMGLGGYFEFPYVVTRWYRRSDEGRGRGPAENALADARLLQAVSAALLEITEKQGNPPMMGPVDIMRGEVEMFPGGFNGFDASGFQFQGDPLRPVQLGANPAMTAEYLREIEAKIADAFFADAFSMPRRDAKMTPEDAAAQSGLIASRLGPIFSRIENELLPPILDRVFALMMRARAFPPVPEELVGQPLIYVFDNHVADMRDINEAQRILQGIAVTAQFGEIPEAGQALGNLDWDVTFRSLWAMMKVPEMFMKPAERVMAERQQAQQMQQAQMAAELMKAGGPGMKSAVEGAVQARDQGLMPQQ